MAEGGHDPRGQKINPSSEDKQRIIRAEGSGRRGASNETEGNQASSCLDESGIYATAQVTGEGKTFRSVMERKRLFEDMKQALSARGSGRKEPTNETGGDQVSSGSEVSVRRATTHVAEERKASRSVMERKRFFEENRRRTQSSVSSVEMSKKDGLKGQVQRGWDSKESPKPDAAKEAALAEGDKISQKFKNTTVSVIAGDQNIGTDNNGQGQRGQLTEESPEPNVATGQVQRGRDTKESPKPDATKNAVLAEGDKESQIFKNTDVSVIAGDQNIGTVNNGQGQRGQLTKESPGPNVARHATLATADHVTQQFINSKVYVAAGDIHVAPTCQSPENKLDQERLRLQAGLMDILDEAAERGSRWIKRKKIKFLEEVEAQNRKPVHENNKLTDNYC